MYFTYQLLQRLKGIIPTVLKYVISFIQGYDFLIYCTFSKQVCAATKLQVLSRWQLFDHSISVYDCKLVNVAQVSRLQFSNDSPRYLSKIEAQKVAPLGELKLSLVYDQQTQQLHVTILKAENLLHLSADTECNAYVKVYLEPGKAVKQQTDVIRSSKNPTFQNSPLTFKNLSKADLKHKSIRLRVCNKMGSGMSLYAKRITIGEVVLPLNQLGLENGDEVRMWKGLEDTCEFQVNT